MATEKERAFNEIVERQRDLIWHVCCDYGLSAVWQPEDAMQEVLLALWRSMDGFRHKSSERTWVYRVATSTMLMLKRKPGNRPQDLSFEDSRVEHTNGEDDGYRSLLMLIEGLPETDRRIVRVNLDGFSSRETAAMLGLSAAAVAMRLSRAKRKIRQQYEKGL